MICPFFIIASAMITLALTACQPAPADSALAEIDPICQSQSAPFAYSICSIDSQRLATPDYALQLFWQAPASEQPLLTFDNLLNTLPASQDTVFAMNGGMYNQSYAPIGYTVIEGEEIRALNLNEGGGNFHLLPNGVLWWDQSGKVAITESQKLDSQLKSGAASPWYATQSGPMLVIEGEIHPKFNPDSSSFKFRNGAGVCSDGHIKFVNSEEPVNFYQFAALFRDDLGCDNALFLDGGIASALYAPNINKHDKKEMGVMVGLITTEK